MRSKKIFRLFKTDLKATQKAQQALSAYLLLYNECMALLAVRLAETESLLNSYLPAEGDDVPMIATKQMQEMQISFNLQYLQLQSQMQQDSRSYTAVSNIMKTKHDTVKNSISNVR